MIQLPALSFSPPNKIICLNREDLCSSSNTELSFQEQEPESLQTPPPCYQEASHPHTHTHTLRLPANQSKLISGLLSVSLFKEKFVSPTRSDVSFRILSSMAPDSQGRPQNSPSGFHSQPARPCQAVYALIYEGKSGGGGCKKRNRALRLFREDR